MEYLYALTGLAVGVAATLLILGRRARLQFETAVAAEKARLAAERLAEAQAEERARDHRLEAERVRVRSELDDERADLDKLRQRLEQRESKVGRREEQAANIDEKLQRRDEQFARREQKLDERLARLDQREAEFDQRAAALDQRHRELDQRQAELDQRQATIDAELERVAGLDQEAARGELFARLDEALADEQGRLVARRVKEATERARIEATEIVTRAIQRYAAEHTAETTTAKVTLPEEDMKGRIIGKEGRNIRAFEQVTGVDLIVDDTPGEITVSCFDGVRREIARRALTDLVADGRIQPARIEEVVARIQQELDDEVLRRGEDAAYTCDVSGLHTQILRLLGKLQYRTSYGQNVLKHTQEVAFLCGAMAADVGLDPKLGRRCGLLHDIGKALDHEQEGSHPELGHEVLKRYGESEIVANAALAHHEGHEVLSLYTTLAAAADAISAARPGARRENVERYIKRLQQLEDIACDFKGVMKAYAVQAGRELRVIVNGHSLRDEVLAKVARDIARRIEDEVAYPGEVRVLIIRESRQQAIAR